MSDSERAARPDEAIAPGQSLTDLLVFDSL
jgi:hypothetical protein